VLAAAAAALVTWIFLSLLGFVVALLSTASSFMRGRHEVRRFRRYYTAE
jgi:hypothetical protein